MRSIGIRELRQRASQLLRQVEAGEVIEVTDRGRPVALLTPVAAAGPLEWLRLVGETTMPEADLESLPEPLEPASGQQRPSAVLARLRADER